MKKLTLFTVGIVILVVGVALILAWWPQVVGLFKGALGIVLALAGLVVLFIAKGNE